MMKYVLIFPHSPNCAGPDLINIMLIRKAKPDWQKGRLNLVGGKVEQGETFCAAAERELQEETGLDGYGWRRAGTIRSDRSDFVIGVYTCNVHDAAIVSEDGEPVDWFVWDDVKNDPALMENLKIAIPLMLAGMEGWTLLHGRDAAGRECCKIEWEAAYVTA